MTILHRLCCHPSRREADELALLLVLVKDYEDKHIQPIACSAQSLVVNLVHQPPVSAD